ncbi:DUF5069 domain-containing protein [Puniceicoccus vermicola]|uniref:DUF5069 domain-containing protein n=1 Tax=Puniceicoccus vermicola TaxID=388746 RepID=A0A7X1B2U8_9BACT|nr:DUF5069 domain-containing protein [Puniceicoccus vermicola]MBC2603390.1 DUF5069 domain-containing protein [Puniceicoccus vermicola]
MTQIIPLISSGTRGPLGVLHLPRLWQKVSLDIAGKLHSEYPAIGNGFDQMVLEGLGIDNESFLKFMASKPTYPQLEAWILSEKGGSLDSAAVEELNNGILGYNHDDETRKGILSAAGIEDDGSILDAVSLNNLEDWQDFHAEVIKG